MNRRGIFTVLLLSFVWTSAAQAQDPERQILARVRLSTDRGAAAGCAPLGRVSDDSLKDLRRKIVRAGGNTGILSFSVQDLEKVYAEVFRCTATPGAPPRAEPRPGIPAPPAGPPPAPPGQSPQPGPPPPPAGPPPPPPPR